MAEDYRTCVQVDVERDLSDRQVKIAKRTRKNLTLEERVRAIHAYDSCRTYTKVARMFNCSWEQIRTIVANRQYILAYFKTKKPKTKCELGFSIDTLQQVSASAPAPMRPKKIEFLNKCLAEYEQRVKIQRGIECSDELLYETAKGLCALMQFEEFTPNSAWLANFKNNYIFQHDVRSTVPKRVRVASFDLQDIIRYCSLYMNDGDDGKMSGTVNGGAHLKRQQQQQLQQTSDHKGQQQKALLVRRKRNCDENENGGNTTDMKSPKCVGLIVNKSVVALSEKHDEMVALHEKRERKLRFLEKVVLEYVQRVQYHHKKQLNCDDLKLIIMRFRDILKIEHFSPNKGWMQKFTNVETNYLNGKSNENTHMLQSTPGTLGRPMPPPPPLSLDLNDIISYCSRIEKQQRLNKSPPSWMTISHSPPPLIRFHLNEEHADQSNEAIKSSALVVQRQNCIELPQQYAYPLKSESIDLNGDEYITDDNIGIEMVRNVDMTMQTEDLTAHTVNDINNNDSHSDNDNSDGDGRPPPLKILKVETINQNIEKVQKQQEQQEPWPQRQLLIDKAGFSASELSNGNASGPAVACPSPPLPKEAQTYEDCLKLLKPIEQFALLSENYRAIGLLTQLEDILKQPTTSDD